MILSTYKIKDMEMIIVEKERRIKTLSVVALIIAIAGLTVAFASLSTTLKINGSANVDSASWDIHFDVNSLENTIIGAGSLNENPTITGTTISKMNMVVTKPGDAAAYVIDVVNNGTINAKVESITVPTLCTLQSPVESCDWNNDGVVTQEDIDKVNDNLTLIVSYNDAEIHFIKKDDLLNSGANNKVSILIGLFFEKYPIGEESYENSIEATQLPARNLIFNDLSVTINYVQAE